MPRGSLFSEVLHPTSVGAADVKKRIFIGGNCPDNINVSNLSMKIKCLIPETRAIIAQRFTASI